jgi:hypothetical protein
MKPKPGRHGGVEFDAPGAEELSKLEHGLLKCPCDLPIDADRRLKVNRVDSQRSRFAVHERIDACDETIAVQHGHSEITESSFVLGHIDLDAI